MSVRALLGISVIVFAQTCGQATDLPMDRATLRGIKALKVVIDLPAGFEQTGITRTALVAELQHQLEKSDIPTDETAKEFLGLRVTIAHEKKTDYAICLSLGVYQNVSLSRDPAVKTTTETWSGESVVLAPPKLLKDAVSNSVRELVDQFVAAFRAAN
jgi:hypothetical protein